MIKINRFLIGTFGFVFTTFGFIYLIIYANLFTFGYSFKEYLIHIFTHFRGYIFLIGVFLILIAVFRKGK